jgi:hypothetical protein
MMLLFLSIYPADLRRADDNTHHSIAVSGNHGWIPAL